MTTTPRRTRTRRRSSQPRRAVRARRASRARPRRTMSCSQRPRLWPPTGRSSPTCGATPMSSAAGGTTRGSTTGTAGRT
eukprot:12881185-Alexandrium_andersonii.AAC.1